MAAGGSEVAIASHSCRHLRLPPRLTEQDIPVPETPRQVVRAGATLCVADSTKYCVIDLAGPHLIDILPISQSGPPDPDAAEGEAFRPEACIAVLPGEEEFLFCSYMGEAGSMGVFVDKAGDAVRGTITWTSHPKSLGEDGSPSRLCSAPLTNPLHYSHRGGLGPRSPAR